MSRACILGENLIEHKRKERNETVNGKPRLNEYKNVCQTEIRKRGRPRAYGKAKAIRLCFRVTWKEYCKLRELASQSGLTLSEFARRKILGG